MKKVSLFLSVVLGLMMVSAVGQVSAQEKEIKGASQTAYEKASDEAVFNRVSDWFATVGKSPEEAAAIKAQRKAERTAKKAQKEAQKQARKAEKEAKKMTKQAEKEAKKAGNQVEGAMKGLKKGFGGN